MAKRKTTEDFIKEAIAIHGTEYDYSKSKYINNHTKICIICKKHGEFWQLPQDHLKGHGCKLCSHRSYKYSFEELIMKFKQIHGDLYDYSKSEYKNKRTKMCIICPIHGEFWQTPSNHMSGHGCPKCSKNVKYTNEEIINEFKKVHGDLYDYTNVEYINNHTKVCIICKEHGEFWQTPNAHLQGQHCPKCHVSNLELEIKNFLQENKIDFIEQYKQKWLGKQTLDYYLPKYNIAIECQGIQHFMPIKIFGGEEKFKYMQQLDERKQQLCNENGIKILYYSNLKIDYPYEVIENKTDLLNIIKSYETSN